MRSICVVLLDGLGDRASPELGGRTANEAAETPALDALCARGSCGLLWPLGPGRAPSSEVAHWRLLGYAPEEFPGRAVLEARGAGLEPEPSEVVGFAALRPAAARDGALWVTGRARDEDDERTRALLEAVDDFELGGLRFSLHPLGRGEAILRIAGGADERVTDTDPFFRGRDPVLRPRALCPGAEATAAALEAWTRAVHERAGGWVPTVKWLGRARPVPPAAERLGLEGALVGASRFLRGLAATVGLRFVEAADSPDPAADLDARLAAAAGLLEEGATLVWVHTKASDEAGHTKDPRQKLQVTGALDAPLARLAGRPFSDAVVCVTGDHATPASPEVIHSGDPVPFVLAGPGVRADRVEAFGELSCRDGILGHLRGEDVMPVLLNAADRPLFAGSRPTPDAGALGHPLAPDPLEVA